MSLTQSPSNPQLRSSLSSDFTVLTPPGMNGEFETPGFGFPLSMTSLQSSHLSLEEALRRVMELMKENQELKETLHKSNLSMRQTCQTLTQWKDGYEVEKKQMDEQRKEFNLRKEQARSVVENLQTAIKERDEMIQILKNQANKMLHLSGERCTESFKEEYLQLQNNVKKSSEEASEARMQIEAMNIKMQELKRYNEELCQDMAMLRDSENDLKLAMQAVKDEKQSLDEKLLSLGASLQKMRENFDTVQMEKRDLVALNNDLTAQVHQLKSSAAGDASLGVHTDEDSELVVVERVAAGEPTVMELINQAAEDDPSLKKSHFDFPRDEQGADSYDVGVRRRGQTQNSMSDLLIQMQDERTKVTELMAKLSELNSAVEDLQKSNRDKEQQINELKAKLNSTVQQGHEDKSEVLRLQMELQKQHQQKASPEEDIQNYKAQVYSLCEELRSAQHNYNGIEENKRLIENRCQQLQNKCLLYQDEIEKQRAKDDQLIEALRVTITSLEANIHSEQARMTEKSALYEDLQKKFDGLVKDYHELLQCNEELQANQGVVGLSGPEKKRYEERIDHLTAQIVCSEEALQKRDKIIRDLHHERENLAEQVPVLNAQADVFRADFEAERRARESLANEKESLKEDIKQLQVRNQQLQDEVQNLGQYQWGAMRNQPTPPAEHRWMVHDASPQEIRSPAVNPHYDYNMEQNDQTGLVTGAGAARSPTPQHTPQEEYVCPKCNKAFASMEYLQLHVMDCIQ